MKLNKALLIPLIFSALAQAQVPFVPEEWINQFGRQQDNSSISFCVDNRDPDKDVAREIANSIAKTLLLKPKIHPVGDRAVQDDLEELYKSFIAYCDIYMGFKLLPGAYPNWIGLTRAYYEAEYLLLVKNTQKWKSLSDIPISQPIGSSLGTSADLRLIQYLGTLKPSQRWTRFPMANDAAALKAVTEGKVAAALVWGPSFWKLQAGNAAFKALKPITARQLGNLSIAVGGAMRSDDSFLRTNVDKAIGTLARNGTLEKILARFKFPATVGK